MMKNNTMFDDRARALLQEPFIVRVTTMTPADYPHTVPVWFILDGETLVVFTERSTQKVRNVLTNPKGNIAIGGDPVGSPCYLIEGDFTIEEDPGKSWTKKITYHYEPDERADKWLADWEDLDFVILRLRPVRVIKVS